MVQNNWRRFGWLAVLLMAGTIIAAAPVARAASDSDAAASPGASSDSSGDSGGDSGDADTSAQSDAASRADALAKVGSSCTADVNRFCPELGDDPAPHDAVMCLRAYNVDLSLSCRNAIHTASH